MRKMKVLSILAFCFMLVITGCSTKKAAESTPSPSASAVTETAKPTEEPTPTPVEVPDLKGRVIKVAAWWDLKPAGETASDKARLEKIAEVEKKYNVTIEFVNVPFTEYMDKFTTTVLAGEPFADIVQLEFKSALPAALKGQLLKTSEFTTPENDINNDAILMKKLSKLAGEDYAFDPPGTNGPGIHYNRELITKYGLTDPQELYKAGNWNWDTFLQLAKDATKDVDNDGKTDVWGYSGWSIDFIKHFTAANGGHILDTDNAKEGLSDPKTLEAAEFANKLWNIDKVVFVKTGNKTDWNETNTFKDGNVALFVAYNWQMPEITFDVGVVPIPNGPQGSPEATYADTAAAGKFIPKGVADAQLVYQIYEETFDIPQIEEYPGQDWLEGLYKHQEDIDMVREHINGTNVTVLNEAYTDYPFNDFVEDIIAKNLSVAATAEKFKQQAQASVDKLGK